MSKSNIIDAFFSLLRAGLWEENPSSLNIRTKEELKSVLEIAKSQSVQGLIFNAILQNTDVVGEIVSAKTLEKFQNFLFANASINSLLNRTLIKVSRDFSENDIHYVLLKGQGVATYYQNPFIRQCGDIDIYVGPENYNKACGVISAMSKKEGKDGYKHFHLEVDGVIFEIHRVSAVCPTIKLNSYYTEFERKGLVECPEMIKVEDYDVVVPEKTFNLLFTFYHAWYHFVHGGLGLRQICDISQILNVLYDSIDIEYFEYMLDRLILIRPWKFFAWIMANYIGLDENKIPLYKKNDVEVAKTAEKILKLILKEGNFGHSRKYAPKTSKNKIYQKIRSFVISSVRFFRIYPFCPKYIGISYLDYLRSSFGIKRGDEVGE